MPAELLATQALRRGSSAYILHSDQIREWLLDQFWARGLCIKVFPRCLRPEDEWEFVPLLETARVQNLFAAEGWAPWVHAVGQLPSGVVAEVVDWAEVIDGQPPDPETLAPFWELVDRHGIGTRSRRWPGGPLKWDFLHPMSGGHWSGRWLLDWGGKYRKALYPEWDEPEPSRVWVESQ
jgi:hypothetical protein